MTTRKKPAKPVRCPHGRDPALCSPCQPLRSVPKPSQKGRR